MQRVRYKWVRYAFLLAGGLIFLFALVFPEWARLAIKRDREQAAPRQGIATVALVVPAQPAVMGEKPSPPLVSVRFHGSILPVKTIIGFSQLQTGQTVQIVYRVGRSGRIYIDTAEPLPAASSSAAQKPAQP